MRMGHYVRAEWMHAAGAWYCQSACFRKARLTASLSYSTSPKPACLQVLLCQSLPFCLVCQAASANVEKSRSLTWDQAMKAGDAPLPPAEDDVYVDTGSKADIHQLAAAVRKHRQLLSDLQQQWNELVRVRPRCKCYTPQAPPASCWAGQGLRLSCLFLSIQPFPGQVFFACSAWNTSHSIRS
jgi:hypothetical protein